MTLKLDHVIFGCADLDAGAASLGAQLGADPAGRGAHQMMGTHNALWNMGDAYIELVAVDPAAPHPGRPRWFGLDDPDVLARIAHGPRLLTWAVAGSAAESVAAKAPMPIGEMEVFSRDDLSWRVAIPDAGTPGMDGVFPLTLDWTAGLHPAKRLGDQGLRYRSLTLSHPAIDLLRDALGGAAMDNVTIEDGAPQLGLVIDTPQGPARFQAFQTQS